MLAICGRFRICGSSHTAHCEVTIGLMRVALALPIKPMFPAELVTSQAIDKQQPQLARQVAYFGNKRFSKAEVFHFQIPEEGLRFISSCVLHKAQVVRLNSKINVLVAVFEVRKIDDVYNLRRLGQAMNKSAYELNLDVQLDGDVSVYGLGILEIKTASPSAKDGLLVIPTSKNDFVFDTLYIQTIGALAVERELVEDATEAVRHPGFLNLGARRHLGNLKHWLSLPSSDSSRLFEEIELLRKSIRIDERRDQVIRSLEHHSRRLNISATTFVAAIGSSITFLGSTNQLEVGSYALNIFACVIFGLLVSGLTWLAAGA